MVARRLWYLAKGLKRPSRVSEASEEGVFGNLDVLDLPEDIRRRTVETRVLSPPWWTEAHKERDSAATDESFERSAPKLYTTEAAAQRELDDIRDSEPDLYVQGVNDSRAQSVMKGEDERHGEDRYNEAVDKSEPYRVYGIDADILLAKLEDAEFSRVMLDGRLKSREDMIEELRQALDEE